MGVLDDSFEALKALENSEFIKTIDLAPFTNRDGSYKAKALAAAYKQWQLETPLRQQERVGKASIDLGLENTPEVIAGGTASTQRKNTPRVAASTSSNLATALGVGAAIGNLSTSLGVR